MLARATQKYYFPLFHDFIFNMQSLLFKFFSIVNTYIPPHFHNEFQNESGATVHSWTWNNCSEKPQISVKGLPWKGIDHIPSSVSNYTFENRIFWSDSKYSEKNRRRRGPHITIHQNDNKSKVLHEILDFKYISTYLLTIIKMQLMYQMRKKMCSYLTKTLNMSINTDFQSHDTREYELFKAQQSLIGCFTLFSHFFHTFG